MTTEALPREATATIRGYIYQFDATILKLLELPPDETLTIEGIEDFDFASGQELEFSQVKYYASQKLTDAVLRDAILPMLKGFLAFSIAERSGKTYVLYGHFKEAGVGSKSTDLAELQRILVRATFEQVAGARVAHSYNLQAELSASDADLIAFANCLSIKLVDEYQTHKIRVIERLSSNLNVSLLEAKTFTYPTALTLVSGLAATSPVSARILTGSAFKAFIRPQTALYNEWMLREEGEAAYCANLKRIYFSSLNIDATERFFVLSGMDSYSLPDLIDATRWLVDKWSSYSMNRKPDTDRYAPYLYITGLSQTTLLGIKRSFDNDGMILLDGYRYHNATFDSMAIQEPQTRTRRIAVRFIESTEQLAEILNNMRGRRNKLIVQLYVGNKQEVPEGCRHIMIPVKSLKMLKSIL